MNDTVLKIALAAFLHDIGKFADGAALNLSPAFIQDHADLYQPFDRSQKRHTHPHAVYTAGFLEHLKDFLPNKITQHPWGDGEAFINLASGHHRPGDSSWRWIVALADRVSSGWDRAAFERDYNYQPTPRDYKKTRLLSLFEQLRQDGCEDRKELPPPSFRYALEPLSLSSTFPRPEAEVTPKTIAEADEQYLSLFGDFRKALGNLMHREENLELWFEHLDSLLLAYTAALPSDRVAQAPDVSLYDHSRATAALAAAIYLYHRDANSLTVEAICNYDDKKFLLLAGDFYGIQPFIFRVYGDVRKYRAKLLRGRSFAVSLYTELAADLICRAVGLPFISVLFNAAGKFCIVAPNTRAARLAVDEAAEQLNDWLVNLTYGESGIGLALKEAAPRDFQKGHFADLWDGLHQEIARKKFSRLDMEKHGGVVTGYLEGFTRVCGFCGKRPARVTVGEGEAACNLCRDHIFLGTHLVKEERLAVTTLDAPLHDHDNCLQEPIFGKYQVAFLGGGLKDLARRKQLLRYWALALDRDGLFPQEVGVRLINGYVPVYAESDLYDERFQAGAKTEPDGNSSDHVKLGDPKTLEHLAALALNPGDREGEWQGLAALGILKADVDLLGLLMACGLREDAVTLSRLATLSRQLHFFFCAYLPELLQGDLRFRNVYTVFAGGDDLFLIGPWNRLIDLAVHLRQAFAEYVCHNPEITLSAGLTIHKPQVPLDQLADTASEALQRSKTLGRDRLTLFGETVTWIEMDQLTEIKETLEAWLEREWINQAMLYRLNELLEMAGTEQRLVSGGEVHLEDLDCTRWRALLTYATARNVAKKLKDAERERVVKQVRESLAHWLGSYGSKLKLPLWQLLYNRR